MMVASAPISSSRSEGGIRIPPSLRSQPQS
jgi:hypothetical protein